MRETITQVSNNLTEKWTNLPQKQKLLIGVGAGVIFIAIVISTFIFTRPQTAILYQNIDMEAISQITQVLEDQNIDYTLIDDGRTIELNEADINNAKILLTRENIPKGTYTFYDAISTNMTTTESEKQTRLIYLKQVDLENILMDMGGISNATVQLNVPEEKNSFLASKVQSSASVVLTLQRQISDEQIEGIARLIATAVDNLKVENITILDSDSNVLFSGDTIGEITTTDQQNLKNNAEQDIVKKITALLSPIYDEVAISPNLILDFDYLEQTSKIYNNPLTDSTKGFINQESTTNYDATNIGQGATPGMDPNLEPVPEYVMGNENTGEYAGQTADYNYIYDETISNQIKNLGSIDYNNSSIAINVTKYKVYDQNLLEDTLPEDQTWEQFKLDNEETIPLIIDDLTIDAVKKGAGLENVAIMGYEKPYFIDKEPFKLAPEDFIPYIILLALGGIIVMVMIKFKKPEEEVETEAELDVDDIIQILEEEAPVEDSLQDIELREVLETKEKIDKFIDEKPEAVAGLLRSWLEEDWGD